jgi:hypothetical protein
MDKKVICSFGFGFLPLFDLSGVVGSERSSWVWGGGVGFGRVAGSTHLITGPFFAII